MLTTPRAELEQRRVGPIGLPSRQSPASVVKVVLLGSLASLAVLLASPALHIATPVLVAMLALSLVGMAWLALRNLALQRDLQGARVRSLDATDLERQRIQRDLHDSAQQRLVSVRIHLGLLAERREPARDREAIERLGRELDQALADIRSVTRDGSPQLLLRNGVADGLRSVAAHAPMPVTVEADTFGRYPPAIERGVYYCCLEALQNVAKHAGPRATVRIRLNGTPARISFIVEDSGIGFDRARVVPGAGLVNLADRVAVMGGRLTIDSHAGMGTRIRGDIPLKGGRP
jgi:signal transduction histidine kinase